MDIKKSVTFVFAVVLSVLCYQVGGLVSLTCFLVAFGLFVVYLFIAGYGKKTNLSYCLKIVFGVNNLNKEVHEILTRVIYAFGSEQFVCI
jgi:hypothetical protein